MHDTWHGILVNLDIWRKAMLNESDPLHIILSTGLCIKSEHLAERKNYTQNKLTLNDDVHVTCQHLVCNLYVFIEVFEFWLQTLLLQ